MDITFLMNSILMLLSRAISTFILKFLNIEFGHIIYQTNLSTFTPLLSMFVMMIPIILSKNL